MSVLDFVIVGSGFGGSVCALRLAEKGYRVAVLELGRRFRPEDLPRSNTQIRRWLWAPALGCRGPFRMTFLPHLTALAGVGVGGGSLVYANTLPTPSGDFFGSPTWSHLADWEAELSPHYATARRMLGVTRNPLLADSDLALQRVARRLGRDADWSPNEVGVYFGEPGVSVGDPYFGGEGPDRTGCVGCGGCMLGCPYGAKNTLETNYLYLAERRGAQIHPLTEVDWIRSVETGYEIAALRGLPPGRRERVIFRARRVILAAGVLGTVGLLLKLRAHPDGLPGLSPRLGSRVRTNSECLIGVTTDRTDLDMSKGIAIGSILRTDAHSHMEPVRYPEGSDFFGLLASPHVGGRTLGERLRHLAWALLRHPGRAIRARFAPHFARSTMILLYMRSMESHLRLRRGRSLWTLFREGTTTALEDGPAPTNSIPEATAIAHEVAAEIHGFPQSLITETLLGIPTTAHILGGCCMGASAEEGVIDASHRVFGYPGLYVVDGSAVSANLGVNPSLTITAMAERAAGLMAAGG